jgi:hypothetical protein
MIDNYIKKTYKKYINFIFSKFIFIKSKLIKGII